MSRCPQRRHTWRRHTWRRHTWRIAAGGLQRAAAIVWLLLLAACQPTGAAVPGAAGDGALPPQKTASTAISLPAVPNAAVTDTPTPFAPASATPLSPTSAHTAPPPAPVLYLPADLPAGLRQGLILPPEVAVSSELNGAQIILAAGEGPTASRWVYALAAPFPTLVDEVSGQDVRLTWAGAAAGPFAASPLLITPETVAAFTALWGPPSGDRLQVLPTEQLLEAAWTTRPAWALLPFEALQPGWKVLMVDGQSPVRKTFDPAAYPLIVPFTLQDASGQALTALPEGWSLPASNRDPARMTVVAMTGVTALVRATAWTMEQKGITYPAEDVGGLLSSADITHISNEVPFDENCPPPQPIGDELVFCSSPAYMDLLKVVGTDVVELTGDHFADYGSEATLFTLDLYRQEGWPYYGGGTNAEEARQPVLFEHNGNKIAFIGCNAKGGGYATADADTPGAVACDFPIIQAEITRLHREGYLVIATFQHFEYYTYTVLPKYRPDFTSLVDAGAAIVQGSQAHQPQNFELYQGRLIHYGLGNLFFDQYTFIPTAADGFIDQHIFYAGHHISTELITIRFIDYARPRLMTPEERINFLSILFNASGW